MDKNTKNLKRCYQSKCIICQKELPRKKEREGWIFQFGVGWICPVCEKTGFYKRYLK